MARTLGINPYLSSYNVLTFQTPVMSVPDFPMPWIPLPHVQAYPLTPSQILGALVALTFITPSKTPERDKISMTSCNCSRYLAPLNVCY